MDPRSTLAALLSRARRRLFRHLALDQCVFALMIGMGGVILLLLAGTQILDWYWVALLAVASLGVGLFRLRTKFPTRYVIAQRIDRKLGLADSLSTATFFSSPGARGDQAVCERQRQDAESAARSVDLRRGVPFRRPRFVYPALALLAIAAGLFGLRYAVTGSLNLQPSIVQIALDTFFPARQELAKANRKLPDRLKQVVTDPNPPDSPDKQSDLAQDTTQDATDPPDADRSDTQDQARSPGSDQPPDNQDQSMKPDSGPNSPNQQDAKESPSDSKSGNQQNAKQDSKPGSDQQETSLMDKLKDAMSNMWAKMTQPKEGQQSPPSKNNQPSEPRDKNGQKSSQSQNGTHSADPDAKGDQEQGEGDQKQSSDAAGTQKGMESKADDQKSGIGSADGDKNARQAEQLAAMGKISEILGKRSANLTGEVMVEVGSSKQQLKTPFAERQATHTEAGGEIHRDEVPLMYQQFVQQYFEAIRKTPSADGAAKPAAAKPRSKTPSE